MPVSKYFFGDSEPNLQVLDDKFFEKDLKINFSYRPMLLGHNWYSLVLW